MTQWAQKNIAIFLICLFVVGCGGPKRGPIEKTTTSGGSTTSGTTGAGASTRASGAGVKGQPPAKSGATSTGGGTSGTPATTPSSPEEPSSPAVRFAEVKPIFQNHCITCHFKPRVSTAVEVDWSDHSATVSYVQNGKLLEKVWTLKDDFVKGMPMGNGPGVNGQTMTLEERELIKKWIEGGGLE